jgi:hypothetical protein
MVSKFQHALWQGFIPPGPGCCFTKSSNQKRHGGLGLTISECAAEKSGSIASMGLARINAAQRPSSTWEIRQDVPATEGTMIAQSNRS